MIIMKSAETIAENIDLLTEILLRLPVGSLLKFKCVSKRWLYLISDPRFCFKHSPHQSDNQSPIALFLKNEYSSTPELQVIPLKHDTSIIIPIMDCLKVPQIKILQSCNGLLLCSSSFSMSRSLLEELNLNNLKLFSTGICSSAAITDGSHGFRYYICIPITKQFKIVSFPNREFEESLAYLYLAFDPLKSPHYKIISLCRVINKKRFYKINTYSSETDSWSPLEIAFTAPRGLALHRAVFCNYAIHWYNEMDVTSLYFDVERQSLKTMPMPPLADDPHRDVRYFGESQGRLHLVVPDDPFFSEFDVLEMMSDYSCWFIRYRVNLGSIKMALPKINWHDGRYTVFSILSVIQAKKEEDSMVVLLVNRTVILYSPKVGICIHLCDLSPTCKIINYVNDFEGWSEEYKYYEILCCLS